MWHWTLGFNLQPRTWREGFSTKRHAPPTLVLCITQSCSSTPFYTKIQKRAQHGIFWKGDLWRRGSVWKEQMDYFFLFWRMRSAPGHPSSWTPPPSTHAHLGGRRILKARPPRLRQCAQQRTPRDQRTSANRWPPAALDLNHPPTHPSWNHGGSGGSLG